MADESQQPEGLPAEAAAEETPTPDAGAQAPTAQRENAAPNAAPTVAEHAPEATAKRREMTGVVLSNKADKTISVRIDRRVKHPVYGKIVRRSSKLAAHDERNECSEGDVVTIVETRPISKTKSWRLGRIVERAGA